MNLVPTHSNCTSPMDYISHHALHSHIPVHHYTNHTAVTIHSSLWLPHHTCTSFSHSHKSSTQTLTQCEVLFCPGYISERSSPYLLSLFVTPDCLTLDFWTCACDLDPCLVLFTSLLCLRYSCYALWPLPVWFCLCPINIYYCTWIPCLWPVFTVADVMDVRVYIIYSACSKENKQNGTLCPKKIKTMRRKRCNLALFFPFIMFV